MSIEVRGSVQGLGGQVARFLAEWQEGEGLVGGVTSVPVAELSDADSPRTAGEDSSHTMALAEVGDQLPPIIVHRGTNRVIDGMHRLRAAKLREDDYIDVWFFDGTEEDAFVLAVTLNTRHGLPLSRADRTAAALRIIRSHPEWSNRVIASVSGLSDKTIAVLRRNVTAETPQSNVRIGADGRSRPVDLASGRERAGELIKKSPNLPLRKIAQEAGIAVSTAKDVRDRIRSGQDPVPARQRAEVNGGKANGKEVYDGLSEALRNQTMPPSPMEVGPLLEALRRDPSVRHTIAGRAVLRLFQLHLIKAEEWAHLAQRLPPHCSAAMAQVARACGESWLYFARKLESRRSRGSTYGEALRSESWVDSTDSHPRTRRTAEWMQPRPTTGCRRSRWTG